MNRKERNDRICQLYREGWTQENLGYRFRLSKMRVNQILAGAGFVKEDRPRLSTTRTEFTGFTLASEVKSALRAFVKRQDPPTTMSQWLAKKVEAALKDEGVVIEPVGFSILRLPQLPFDAE